MIRVDGEEIDVADRVVWPAACKLKASDGVVVLSYVTEFGVVRAEVFVAARFKRFRLVVGAGAGV